MNKIKLGSVLKIKHGYAFKTENYVPKSRFRLVTLGNFEEGNNSFKYNDFKATYYEGFFPEEVILQPMDLIMPLTEQVIGLFGNSAFIPESEDYTFVLNQRVGKVVVNEKKLDKIYAHYLLATENVKKQLEHRATGTRQRNISPKDVYDVSVILPSVNEQKRIGMLLYSIEEKQKLNNKIISELESMVKTLYDYWFLQFDFPDENGKPYKSSGGKMVWNEELKREIPEGWSVKRLNDLVTIIDNRGKNPPYMDCKTEYPIIDVATLRKEYRCIDYSTCSHYVNKDIYDNWFRAGHPKKGDILFSTVGSLAEIKLFYPNKCIFGAIAQNIVALRSTSELYSYLYQVLLIEKQRIIGYRIGSVQPSLKVGHVLEHKVLVPNIVILGKYSNTVENINLEINQCIMENQELASLRDFLLPMLMNGQVTFKE